jgi:prepilin-type N-terminal cleavage/methylation domain-containing protein
MSRSHKLLWSQDGMTLVEVTVAIVVLLVGVLGTVTMIDGANAVTSRTKAREGGTALARTALEIARGVPYKDLSTTQLLSELQSPTRVALNDSKPGVTGHQITSRGFTYTLTPVVCSMDDPKDNLGIHDEDSLDFCTDSDVGSGSGAIDRNPDDYRRVSVQLSWQDNAGGHAETVKQTGVVTNPVGGLGPSVTSLDPDVPATTLITSGTSASYEVTTSTIADTVNWSINGVGQGEATGEDTAWAFTWDLGPVNAPLFVDCNYVVQAEAYDEKGRVGAPLALTVTLNRRNPFPPPNFAGGRNLNGDRVDVQWDAGPECDIQRYEVYRGTSLTAIDTLVCTRALGAKTECVDEGAPTGQLYYQVLAVDKDSSGNDRDGERTAPLAVVEGNVEPPTTPAGLTVCSGGNPACTDIDGETAPVGTAVLSWEPATDPDGIDFYRVYRDGNTYADRLDILFPVASKPLVFVDSPSGSSHEYRVSAVDSLFGESVLSDAVTWPP